MSTTTLNPMSENNSDKKRTIASYAATATTAAGIGAAAAIASTKEEPESLIDKTPDTGNPTVPAGHHPTYSPTATQGSSGPETSADNDTTPTATEPATTTETISATTSETETAENPEVADINDPEAHAEDILAEPEEETGAEVSEQENNADVVTEDVNPDVVAEEVKPEEVADVLIAESQIDPSDIDMADVINFEEIGTVYTVDGESHIAASYQDAAGNQLVMVDVDNDNVFDVIADSEGTPLTDAEGNMIAVGGDITVDDAEINIADEGTYLASNDSDSLDDFGTDTIMNDLIS